MACLLLAAVPLVAPGPGLVPAAVGAGPDWLLGIYGKGFGVGPGAYYALLWVAFAAYLCVLIAAPALDRRLIRGVAVVLVIAFALAPPLLSQDVFSYIAYARLGAVHGLNPYAHAPIELVSDPSYAHVGWTESPSSYGPLFTLATYPLALISVPAALWALKGVAAASVLALALLVARMAPARGVDPRRGFVLVALNPLVLVHVVGGAHNDATTMLVALAGCAAVLALRRERRRSGRRRGDRAEDECRLRRAVRASRVGPALPVPGRRGARRRSRSGRPRWPRSVPMHLDSVELVGESQGRVSNYSLPNLISELLGVGIGPIRAITAAAFAVLMIALGRWVLRGGDWVRATAWAALGLLLASSWLLPWYIIWALPFAALSRDNLLITAVLALTALQLVARIPL